MQCGDFPTFPAYLIPKRSFCFHEKKLANYVDWLS